MAETLSNTAERMQSDVLSQDNNWHALPEEKILEKLQTTQDGLSDQQAARRLEEYGPNTLPVKPPPTLLAVLLHQFLSPLIYILLVAGVVSLLLGEIKDAVFIFIVVLLNAAIGTYQEWKAERSASALQSLLTINARVKRSGRQQQVTSEELVPGDVVLLESGNRVPADLRLIQTNNLAVDESFLTGESLAADKNLALLEVNSPVSERANMAFAGSTVTSGRGTGVVVATGLRTEVGRIAETATSAAMTKPPLVVRMERFARQTSYAVLGASAVMALIAVAKGIPYSEVFFLAVALAVSAIPEGLPVAITVVLSIGTTRMARRNVIVRRLAAVESLGSCTYIASDKTGTLTVNQQTVKIIALPSGESFTVSGEGYSGEGQVLGEGGKPLADPAAKSHLDRLARAVILSNEAQLTRDNGQWTYDGDAMDVALLAFGYKLGLPPERVRGEVESVSEIPFESERGYAAHFYRVQGQVRVAVKGAVERILPLCRTKQVGQSQVELDPEKIEQEALALSEDGYRVLVVAEGEVGREVGDNFEEKDISPLNLLGVVGFIDPLRPEVKDAVAKCQQAGVEVAMVTGDHPATALAIARQLGIASSWDDVVTGRQLDEIGSNESPEFLEKVKAVRVFARVTPFQKLHIVEALIQLGHFIAVTGDGVNDAPALRKANIGVAMGSGTDIAKDTASIIVTDDNFASIEAGVEEGRFAYDNIRKVTYLLISTGAAEVILITLALVADLPLPLFAVQLLWLNLVTNGIQDVALAFEAGEPGAMRRPPRRPTEGIFNRLMVQQTAVAGTTMGLISFGTWYWLLQAGWDEAGARNLVLLLMVLFQNFHVFNCRSESVSAFKIPLRRNVILVAGVAAALGLHLLSMQVPFMQNLLRIGPVSLAEFFYLLLLASSVLIVMEIFKLLGFSGRR